LLYVGAERNRFHPHALRNEHNVVWAEDLAELLDARISELAEGRDVITVTTAALAARRRSERGWGGSARP
jgi:hypothetical protein